jgi:2-dehydropantoate 2-reductase
VRIVVLGAGALGGYFGARLQSSGHEVVYVARGAHLQAMQRGGLSVESPLGDITLPKVTAVDSPEAAGQAQLVLFMVKNYDVEAAAKALAPSLGPDTLVMTVQNGVTAPEILAREIGAERVLPGAVYMPADIREPGVIRHSANFHRVVFGTEFPSLSKRVEEIAKAIEGAGIDVTVAADIRAVLWEKFLLMSASSSITALTRLPMGPVRETPETLALMRHLVAETERVARAEHPGLASDAKANALNWLENVAPPGMRASMLDDLLRGKPLELNWLSGEVVRRGKRLGIETPAHEFAVAVLAPHAAGKRG